MKEHTRNAADRADTQPAPRQWERARNLLPTMGVPRPRGHHDPPRHARRRTRPVHARPRVLHPNLRSPLHGGRLDSLPRPGLLPRRPTRRTGGPRAPNLAPLRRCTRFPLPGGRGRVPRSRVLRFPLHHQRERAPRRRRSRYRAGRGRHPGLVPRALPHRIRDRVPGAPAPPRRRARRRGDPAAVHPARVPGRGPRNPLTAHRAGVARA